MADFIQFTLDDGSTVEFESAESDLISPRGGQADIVEGGKLTDRMREVAKAAEEVSRVLRSRLTPSEIGLEFGLKASGEVNWWFFAKAHTEGNIKVTLKWTDAIAASEPGTHRNNVDG